MAGQLKTHALIELIREISSGGLSGALRLARERVKTVIYFDSGAIIYAASNLRPFRLIEFVRRWNVLNHEQLARMQNKATDQEVAAAIVSTGALTRENLALLVERQVTELILQTLTWTEGEWDFDSRVRVAGDTRVPINTSKLLLESVRLVPKEFAASKLENKDEKILPAASPPEGLDLLPIEAFVLTRVEQPISIEELVSVSGLPAGDALHAIYILSVGGFLRRETWPQPLSAEQFAKARVGKDALPKKKSALTPTQSARPATPKEPADEKSEIEALFARIHSTSDYYHLIGVPRSAGGSEIKAAYYGLAKRFHPDRFRRNAEPEQLVRIESAFAQIAQAYDTLKDKTSRAVYDSKLFKQEASRSSGALPPLDAQARPAQEAPATNRGSSGPLRPPEPVDAPVSAEEKFQQGLAALQQGNHAYAIAALGEAARLTPTEPRYRAHLGAAMAKDERLRHRAETELRAAIQLDEKNASYRVMLAEFYNGIGLVRRAQTELGAALSLDSQNKSARELLGRLKGRG